MLRKHLADYRGIFASFLRSMKSDMGEVLNLLQGEGLIEQMPMKPKMHCHFYQTV